MNFTQALIVLIFGFVVNYTIVNGMALDNCDEKLTREDYIELDKVCDECFEEWGSMDIYYNCPEKCFKNDHFNLCLEYMPSISQEVKDMMRNKTGLVAPNPVPITGK